MGKTIVIMPGGFHPFHAGHLALYQSAQRAFPDAEVYVAATNDTAARPFPFAVKEKLAKLAGVEPGHFVQVKSPFRAEEITAGFDPSRDVLIFVRSEKDQNSPPKPGGIKKDGSPSYLQPLLGAERLEPFAKHAYMAYLPTVEFGPGLTSATQIRTAWPTLDERRKTALVMSLYPRTQGNAKLAATVVRLLDAAIGGTEGVAEGSRIKTPSGMYRDQHTGVAYSKPTGQDGHDSYMTPAYMLDQYKKELARIAAGPYKRTREVAQLQAKIAKLEKQVMDENQGWAATLETVSANGTIANTSGAGAGMTATYQRRENQPVSEDYLDERRL